VKELLGGERIFNAVTGRKDLAVTSSYGASAGLGRPFERKTVREKKNGRLPG